MSHRGWRITSRTSHHVRGHRITSRSEDGTSRRGRRVTSEDSASHRGPRTACHVEDVASRPRTARHAEDGASRSESGSRDQQMHLSPHLGLERARSTVLRSGCVDTYEWGPAQIKGHCIVTGLYPCFWPLTCSGTTRPQMSNSKQISDKVPGSCVEIQFLRFW